MENTQTNYAHCALKFALNAQQSAKNTLNTEWIIAGNVPKPAEGVLMNAGKFQHKSSEKLIKKRCIKQNFYCLYYHAGL